MGECSCFLCLCGGETGRVKNYLGEYSLKITRPNGERSAILVSNPGLSSWLDQYFL